MGGRGAKGAKEAGGASNEVKTKKEFDDYWVKETREGVRSEVKEKISAFESERTRLQLAIKNDPNNPGNAQIKKRIDTIDTEISDQKARLKARISKPSEFFSKAQYDWHLEKYLTEK